MRPQFRTFCSKDQEKVVHPDDIVISDAKREIRKSAKDGFLALKVTNELEYDKDGYFYNRKQEYESFIDRMMQIYRSEKRYIRNLKKQREINVSLKEVVIDHYQPTLLKLQRIADTKRAKGFVAPAFDDLTTYEIEDSLGLNDAINDIEQSLLPGNYFPPHNIAHAISSLSQIRYKNTELIPKIRNKMISILTGTDTKMEDTFEANNPIFGLKNGQTSNWLVYSGFKDSKEFYSHVETLLNWKTDEEYIIEAEKEASKIKDENKHEYLEIVQIMGNIVSAVRETKEIQKEMAEAIEAVRSQYSKMSAAFDSNEVLQENPYIKYDLLELQERLVEAGLMHPDEATGRHSLEDMPFATKMNRATEVFYELTQDYYPEMGPVTEDLFGKIIKNPKREDISLLQKESQNQLNLKYIGLILGKLSEMRISIRRDSRPINELLNEKCYPQENENDPFTKRKDPEIERMHNPYTMFWKEVTETYNAMLPKVHEVLSSSQRIPLEDLLVLAYGLSEGQVIDQHLTNLLSKKMLLAKASEASQINKIEDLIYGIQGLANSTVPQSTKDYVASLILPQIDRIKIENLNLNNKLRLMWGLCVLEQFDSKVLEFLVDDFNLMPFELAQNELLIEEYEKLRDIYCALQYLNENEKLKLNNYFIKVLCTTQDDVLQNYPERARKIDPFRERLLNGLCKFYSSPFRRVIQQVGK